MRNHWCHSVSRGVERQLLISVPNTLLSLFLNRANCSFSYLGLDDKPVCIVITNQNKSRSGCRLWAGDNVKQHEGWLVCACVCMCLHCAGSSTCLWRVKWEKVVHVYVCGGSRWYGNSVVVNVILPQHYDATHTLWSPAKQWSLVKLLERFSSVTEGFCLYLCVCV